MFKGETASVKKMMKQRYRFLTRAVLGVLAFVCSSSVSLAESAETSGDFRTEALQAILYDLSTDTVLFEKNPDQEMVPSSMTKTLLVYMMFEKLSQKEVKPDDLFVVSEKAWRMGGSRMFVQLGSSVSFSELLQGVVVQSGNDACIVLAEGLAGSESQFTNLMNTKAKALGAQNTHFLNCTGWPESGHVSTARDLLIFGIRTWRDFPELYAQYYPQKIFVHNGIEQYNRNPLLSSGQGDGLKTGHTKSGGFGFLGSGQRGDRRVIFVVNGLGSDTARKEASLQMLKHGLDGFEVITLYDSNGSVGEIPLLQGGSPKLFLKTLQPIRVTIRRGTKDQIKTKITLAEGSLKLPIQKDQQMGTLTVQTTGLPDKTFPVFAAETVLESGLWARLVAWVKSLWV